jgi:hypothetical protein
MTLSPTDRSTAVRNSSCGQSRPSLFAFFENGRVAANLRRRGELEGPAGIHRIEAADAFMRSENIFRPDRMTAMIFPGVWSVSILIHLWLSILPAFRSPQTEDPPNVPRIPAGPCLRCVQVQFGGGCVASHPHALSIEARRTSPARLLREAPLPTHR